MLMQVLFMLLIYSILYHMQPARPKRKDANWRYSVMNNIQIHSPNLNGRLKPVEGSEILPTSIY